MKSIKRKHATEGAVAAGPAAVPDSRYRLPVVCTVRESAMLRADLLSLLSADEVTLDVGAVERIDTAALQIVFAFVRDRRIAGAAVNWSGDSEGFSEAARLVGLDSMLGVHANGAAR
jgi:phospholipid transport system transporter-binding protein